MKHRGDERCMDAEKHHDGERKPRDTRQTRSPGASAVADSPSRASSRRPRDVGDLAARPQITSPRETLPSSCRPSRTPGRVGHTVGVEGTPLARRHDRRLRQQPEQRRRQTAYSPWRYCQGAAGDRDAASPRLSPDRGRQGRRPFSRCWEIETDRSPVARCRDRPRLGRTAGGCSTAVGCDSEPFSGLCRTPPVLIRRRGPR